MKTKTISYHLIVDTTETGFTTLCGLKIDNKVGWLATKNESEVTCPECEYLIDKTKEYLSAWS